MSRSLTFPTVYPRTTSSGAAFKMQGPGHATGVATMQEQEHHLLGVRCHPVPRTGLLFLSSLSLGKRHPPCTLLENTQLSCTLPAYQRERASNSGSASQPVSSSVPATEQELNKHPLNWEKNKSMMNTSNAGPCCTSLNTDLREIIFFILKSSREDGGGICFSTFRGLIAFPCPLWLTSANWKF